MDSEEYRNKYGIKLIYPKDMYRSPEERIWDDEDSSHENIAMVSKTNTATSQDIADSLAYSWMMSQFHYLGITQLTSRYLYEMHNVPYREYYDALYTAIKNDSIGGPILNDVEEIFVNYFTYGEMPVGEKWKNVVALTMPESYGMDDIFRERKHFIKLGVDVGNTFHTIDNSIVELQHAFMLDNSATYPCIVKSNIDIDRWEYGPCTYSVERRHMVSHMHDQMYQKYLLKTDLLNVTNPYVEDNIEDSYKGNKISVIPILLVATTVLGGRVM
jgi:hypothetical protein